MRDALPDACCVINLFAAGRGDELWRATGFTWHLPTHVAQEALYIRKPDPDDPSNLVADPLDLRPLIDGGLLQPCEVAEGHETALLVELAAELDDGEAAALAICQARGWVLATDDRKAWRFAGERGVTTVTSPELVKAWADGTSAATTEVGEVLNNIQTFARFVPHKTMPLAEWWRAAAIR
jgi:hypothetical protein